MRILVIGNGFDLEHELKTSYCFFLDFLNWIISVSDEKEQELKKTVETSTESDETDDRFMCICKKQYLKYVENNSQIVSEIKSCISNNIWIDYFNNRKEARKTTWIDFESEISKLIRLLDVAKEKYYQKAYFETQQVDAYDEIKELYRQISGKGNVSAISGVVFENYKNCMLVDLQKLIRALEIYLTYWIDITPIEKINPDIADIYVDRVLSFNYTHTYERVYGKSTYNTKYCYLHGEARNESSIDECNIVLGIDDYDGQDGCKDAFFVEFKKYYQCLKNSTDITYKKWIDEIKEDESKVIELEKENKSVPSNLLHEVFVFGHSLDITDKEKLEPILKLKNVKVTVFCLNEQKRRELLGKLIVMLGKDVVIAKKEGKKLEFVIQSESKLINQSNLEIRSDCKKLNNFMKYPFAETIDTYKKVIKKVKSKDLEYFSSTERVISLVGALEYIGLDSPDITNLLVEVAIALIDKSGKKDFYNENEWVEPTVDGRLEVSIEVSKFISFINAYIAKQEFPKEVDFEDDLRKEERKSHSSEEIKAILEKSFEYFIKNNYFSESVMNSIRNIINRSHKAGSDAVKKYMTSGMFETTDNELVYKIYVRELNKICEEVDYYNSMTSPEMLED